MAISIMEEGLIKIILLNKSLFNWFAKITEVAEIFVATTSVFSLMISCTNELINCTYKKLVYLIAGISDDGGTDKFRWIS